MGTLVPGQWWSFYLPDPFVGDPCGKDVEAILDTFKDPQPWTLTLVDAWGKLPDGVLAGNVGAPGSLDQCLDLVIPREGSQGTRDGMPNSYRGQYCTVALSVAPENGTAWRVKDGPRSPLSPLLTAVGASLPYSWYGTCIPDTCTEAQMKSSLTMVAGLAGLRVSQLACQTTSSSSVSSYEISMSVLLLLLLLLPVSAAVVDIFLHYSGKEARTQGGLKYLLAFSLFTNLGKVFTMKGRRGGRDITCLAGMRVVTMAWIVWGHQYIISLANSANKFLVTGHDYSGQWLLQVLFNAMPSVDTFFFMSGLLVAHGLGKTKTTRFNAPVFYLHRFLRLSPPILVLAGVVAILPPLLVRGPLTHLLTAPHALVDNCRRYWWRDTIFVSNYFFYDQEIQSCLLVCWYTAVDFQLYLVAPLMYLPVLYWPKLGRMWLGVLTALSVVIPAALIGSRHLPPGQVQDAMSDDYYLYTYYVYTKPWCRASPYLAGMWVAFILHENHNQNHPLRLPQWAVCVGWAAAAMGCGWVVWGLMNYNTLSGAPHPYSAVYSILYGGLSGLVWGAALGWLVLACHCGYGGPINDILSHSLWLPLARLSYTMFLVAIPVQSVVYMYGARLPTIYTHFSKVMETSGVLWVSMCVALALSLLTEGPVMGLEKLLLKGKA